jgi:transcriptional regulator with XRE-family HTH domain
MLRAQIQLAGMNQERLAKALGWSPSAISNFVTGRRMPQRDHVEKMDAALGADGLLLGRWTDDRKRAAEPSWMRKIVDVEDRAVEIRIVQPVLLPVVAQSPEYARAVVRAGGIFDAAKEIDAVVERRMARAAQLLREDGPRIVILVGEHVIADAEGIAPGSLRRLLEVGESAVVQVIPKGIYAAAAMGAFRVMSFTDRMPLVWAESPVGGQVVDNGTVVARFSAAANDLSAWAHDPATSRIMIEGMLP